MIKSTFITLLKLRLGSRTDADLDTLIPLEADQAIFELQHTGEPPWFLLQFGRPVGVTAGNRTASWPSNYLAEVEDGGLWLTASDSSLVLLDKGDYDSSVKYWGTETGQPVGYSTLGAALQLFPIPDQAYTITLDCFIQDAYFSQIGDASENLWLDNAPDVLLAKTGMRVATFIRDAELVQIFAGEYTAAMRRMGIEHIARMEINRSRRMGA